MRWRQAPAATPAPTSAPACTPGAAGPPPAPDGAAGTAPLRGENLADGTGDTLAITWDSGCAALDYNLIYGNLADVAAYALSGSECSLGTSGSFTWTGVPSGNLYFLIVGHDGSGTESSWGTATGGVERNGGAASAQCGVTLKELTGTCP